MAAKKKTEKKPKYKKQVRASGGKQVARKHLLDLWKKSPLPEEDILVNFGLYLRSSALADILFRDEIYRKILRVPGAVMEFGVWWGHTVALSYNFRAIYEPYNLSRKVIAFDTFEGYPGRGAKDGDSEILRRGGYKCSKKYEDYLSSVLECHEKENTLSHIKKYEILKGDASETCALYLEKHPETVVALAVFDMGCYEPTKQCLEMILPHTVPGSVLMFDELNNSEMPGETVAYREMLGPRKHRIRTSRYLPDRTYVTLG